MKRKILSFLLIFTLIISVSPLTGLDLSNIFTSTASAADVLEHNGYKYTVWEEIEVLIEGYSGDEINLTIPSHINGLPVTTINTNCFVDTYNSDNRENINKIESITLPSTVEDVRARAFTGMESLKKITLSEGVKTIGSEAFAFCPNLVSVNIPQSVNSLGTELFEKCTSLKEITLPGKDITYSNAVFYNSSIEKINLSEGMTIIPDYFFADTKVTTVTVPSTVTEIGANAFFDSYWNHTVETVIFPGTLSEGFYPAIDENFEFMIKKNSPALKNVYFRYMPCDMPHSDIYDISYDEASGYWKCARKEDYSSYELYNDSSFDYIINENGEAVLIKYTGWNPYVVIPETVGFPGINLGTVTEIGSGTFTDTSAAKVIIPDTVKRIGGYAFKNCTTVTTIEFPDSVEEIGNGAFYGCTALETLTLPETVTKIGVKAFQNCTNLKNLNWPSNLTYVPADAFWNCSSFNDFGLFENVEIISGGAFWRCGALIIDDFGDNLKEIGDFAFTDLSEFGSSGNSAVINTENLPENLEYIGNRALAYNKSLKKIKIPENIKHIGEGAFAYSSLEQVDLPDNLKEISKGAFACTSLRSIDLPPKLEKIGDVAFMECLNLEKIEFPDTVTYIGDGAFKACESLTELKIPPKLETINKRAFAGLVSLKEICIPSTVKTIGEAAFGFCDDVTKITIENGVESIGNNAFVDNNIKEITIPESVRELGYGIINDTQTAVVYYNAIELDRNLHRTSSSDYPIFSTDTLKKIVFGKNVKLVPAYCAYDCALLEQIVFTSSIREIDIGAFAYCTSLKYVALPGGVQKIDMYAFADCTSLETVIIPNSVTDISDYAFYDCDQNLTVSCKKDSYAYDYATELGIKVRVTDTQPSADKTPADSSQTDLKKETSDYFASFLNSLMNKIKDFFAQFTIIRR